MTSGTDELHFFYDAQNRPAVVVYNGVPYAYVKSLQGDILAILDENGNAVVSYGYDAWGAPLWCTGELAETLGKVQPFRYRGYVFDEETGLYYLRSRYYRAEWCRFFNADAIIGNTGKRTENNLYAYCANAPLSYFDADGFEEEECDHPFVKNTYTMSGETFYAYLQWQYERHPNVQPIAPITGAITDIISLAAGDVIGSLSKLANIAIKVKKISIPIIGRFINYNYDMEEYFVQEFSRICSIPGGYQTVTIELLNGSHSAEARITLVDQNGNTLQYPAISTQGYEVVLNMMECMQILVEGEGRTYLHEHVGWKYTMVE